MTKKLSRQKEIENIALKLLLTKPVIQTREVTAQCDHNAMDVWKCLSKCGLLGRYVPKGAKQYVWTLSVSGHDYSYNLPSQATTTSIRELTLKDHIKNVKSRMKGMRKYKSIWTSEFIVIDHLNSQIELQQRIINEAKEGLKRAANVAAAQHAAHALAEIHKLEYNYNHPEDVKISK